MTAVKDQGMCGSDWAIAATSTLEGALALKKNKTKPMKISVQEALDCQSSSEENREIFGKDYGNNGCISGHETQYWDFVKDFGALSAKEYP